MASSVNFAQNIYSGEVLEDLLTYTAQGNDTYKEGLIHIKSGIQFKYTIPTIQLGQVIQDNVPTPTSTHGAGAGTKDGLNQYTLTERYLEPQEFMVYLEFNPRDYEKYYKFAQPDGNLIFRELDPKVQSTMIRLLIERKMEYINHAIWCGAMPDNSAKVSKSDGSETGTTEIGGDDAAGPMNLFNGAIVRMLMNISADAESEDAKCGRVNLIGTGTFADGEAVEQELYKMWEGTKPKVRKKQGLVILMDYKSWDAYNKYLSGKYYKYSDNRDENQRRFQGKRIIPMVALPEDTIIMGCFTTGVDSNLWMGIDYPSDEEVLKIDILQNNSELYFFKMLMKIDINIVLPDEITAHIPFNYNKG